MNLVAVLEKGMQKVKVNVNNEEQLNRYFHEGFSYVGLEQK